VSQSDFDRSPVLRNLPIALKRIDIHAEWVSPKVLEMMGPLPESVPGGQIMLDADGKPTGVFVRPAFSNSSLCLTLAY
jgi:predicted amidohydrolase YtcJ